jgi:hypothetical protein
MRCVVRSGIVNSELPTYLRPRDFYVFGSNLKIDVFRSVTDVTGNPAFGAHFASMTGGRCRENIRTVL